MVGARVQMSPIYQMVAFLRPVKHGGCMGLWTLRWRRARLPFPMRILLFPFHPILIPTFRLPCCCCALALLRFNIPVQRYR